MCSVIILRRPGHEVPVLLAANRDEMLDRPWAPPGRHWPDQPEVRGGLDRLAGGTWLAMNDSGLVAAILNRAGSLGPQTGKRSRGELPLQAMDHADAAEAARALAAIDPAAYRPFNLVLADNRDVFVLSHADGQGRAPVRMLQAGEGFTMVTAREPDDAASPRIRFHKPRFAAATPPAPERDDWSNWEQLLESREVEPGAGPEGALFLSSEGGETETGFGTSSSALIALPRPGPKPAPPVWRFAAGRNRPRVWATVEE
jgi:hypothetical protein